MGNSSSETLNRIQILVDRLLHERLVRHRICVEAFRRRISCVCRDLWALSTLHRFGRIVQYHLFHHFDRSRTVCPDGASRPRLDRIFWYHRWCPTDDYSALHNNLLAVWSSWSFRHSANKFRLDVWKGILSNVWKAHLINCHVAKQLT